MQSADASKGLGGARRASLKSGLGLTLFEEEGTDLVGHVLVLVR
jgi:hypothetical protein